jgi:hypothetical protein
MSASMSNASSCNGPIRMPHMDESNRTRIFLYLMEGPWDLIHQHQYLLFSNNNIIAIKYTFYTTSAGIKSIGEISFVWDGCNWDIKKCISLYKSNDALFKLSNQYF